MRALRTLVLAGLLFGPVAAAAQSADVIEAGDLRIVGAEVAATMASAPTAAAYMIIENAGAEADRLVAVETTAAKRTDLHATVVTDGVARMTALEDGIEVPAGGSAALEPRGLHVMLMGLTAPLEAGAEVGLTLVFEHAGRVEILAPVRLGMAMQHGKAAVKPGG